MFIMCSLHQSHSNISKIFQMPLSIDDPEDSYSVMRLKKGPGKTLALMAHSI